jgi:hypothetical protein
MFNPVAWRRRDSVMMKQPSGVSNETKQSSVGQLGWIAKIPRIGVYTDSLMHRFSCGVFIAGRFFLPEYHSFWFFEASLSDFPSM